MNEAIIKEIEQNLAINKTVIERVLELLTEGNTVHFLARYRKEQIGGIDEEQIREIEKVYTYQVQLKERKQTVMGRIDEQGMLTDDLRLAIQACEKLVQLEQLYEPYKSKKMTKAKLAIQGGLEPLAKEILLFAQTPLEILATSYVNETFPTVEEVLENVGYLIAQQMSENISYREGIKRHHYKVGIIEAKVKKKGLELDEQKVFEQYYDFSSAIHRVADHQILAMNRAEKQKIVGVKLVVDAEKIKAYLLAQYLQNTEHPYYVYLETIVLDAQKRLILPSISREIRTELTMRAEQDAINLFGKNVFQLLMQQPLAKQTMLGFDPAFRTGCKLAVIDAQGTLEAIDVIYPHAPMNKKEAAEVTLNNLYNKYQFSIIAIGNGTASRESEQFVGDWIRKNAYSIQYTLVSEAGASVYSASELAIEEFPDLSVEQRSAISIARRILDPLAELVKIDPRSLGVGQYQHDLSETLLKDELGFVVDHSVNLVGVDLNSASGKLLGFVSGITKRAADNIVAWRNENGRFNSRKDLSTVKGFGKKSFEQAAGFLRVIDGENVFDNTSIHPESYKLAAKILTDLALDATDIGTDLMKETLVAKRGMLRAEAYDTDSYTMEAILDSFAHPQRDARANYAAPMLRQDILTIDDIMEGMELEGVVRNITNFGAFIDIGLKSDGFVHVSKMSKQFVNHPSEVVNIGDIKNVIIERVDLEKGRVELSLI